jgi:hypothetical protein
MEKKFSTIKYVYRLSNSLLYKVVNEERIKLLCPYVRTDTAPFSSCGSHCPQFEVRERWSGATVIPDSCSVVLWCCDRVFQCDIV